MIFKFRVVSDEVDNFKREIEIDSNATFLDLKNAICDAVGYDKGQMCSFFICEPNWEKIKEITFEDMGSDSSEDVYIMEDTYLDDFVEDEGQRLLFTFDYLTDRSLFIEMRRIITGRNLKDPVCTLSVGQAPAQISDIDDFADIDTSKGKTASLTEEDLDAEFYGSNEYNPDEFDLEGFDEMSLED